MDIAKKLAQRIKDDDYSPSLLLDCNSLIPTDEHPHVVRFSKLFLFPYTEPGSEPPGRGPRKFVVVGRQGKGGPARGSAALEGLWDGLLNGLPLTRTFLKKQLPQPDDSKAVAKRKLRESSKILKKSGFPPPPDEDGAFQAYLVQFSLDLKTELQRELKRLRQALGSLGCRSLPALPKNWTEDAIADWLAEVFEHCLPGILDDPLGASLRERAPILALCAVCEQLWEPKGYTRGDLLNSFSLAPGEQLTLEISSWDKSSSKSESELASESELRVSSKLMMRDNQQVVQELAAEMGGKLGANGGLTIPIPAGEALLPVTLAATGELQDKLAAGIQDTVEHTVERTIEAASTIKNTRRLRVEVAREVGREEKQTRVIVNTNRCHALNAHYFEVMANYVVTTRPVAIRPCILLACPEFRPANAKWVLSHENLLMQALLDPVFVPGFNAAKVLEADLRLQELKKKRAAAQAAEPSSALAPTDELSAEFARKRAAICSAYGELKAAWGKVLEAMEAVDAMEWWQAAMLGAGGYFAAVVAKLVVDHGADKAALYLRRTLYLAMLQVAQNTINALDALDVSGSMPARESLRNFFAAVMPQDFERNPVAAAVVKGLVALGVPEDLADVLHTGLIDYQDDDAGLYGAIKAAFDRLQKADEGLLPDLSTALVAQEAAQASPAAEEDKSLLALAEAQVEFQRLSDHLLDNKEHYQQAIWLRTHPDVRQRHLDDQGTMASLVTNEIIGFHGDKAAYPIADVSLLGKGAPYYADRLEKAMKEVREKIEDFPTEPFLVTQPTQGTVMEVTLGECDACEEYIQNSRLIDERQGKARAGQEEAEADRRAKLVAAGKLEPFEPCPCRHDHHGEAEDDDG